MKILLSLSLWFIAGAGLLQAKHLLGPTGMFGADGKVDIKVTKVDQGSPADGKVGVGDVIVGVNGAKFQGNPRREMAAAIDSSEGKAMNGRLVLDLKGGQKAELQLKAFGDFSPTAPANCAKTDALVTAVAQQLIADEKQLKGTDLQQQSAIGFFGYKCPPEWALPRIEMIGKVLRDPDEHMEVRSTTAYTLCWYKPQGQAYFNDMLHLLMKDKPGDPFGLIDHGISTSLVRTSEIPFADGLVTDKDLFYRAVHKLSQHPRLGARGAALQLLVHMPAEDFSRGADDVKRTFLNGDPSSHSYSTPGVTLRPGGQLLARLGVKEGPEWAVDALRTGDGKGSFKANGVISVLTACGANAKLAVEEIKADPTLEGLLTRGRWSKAWEAAAKAAESDEGAKPMISFEEAKQGKLAE